MLIVGNWKLHGNKSMIIDALAILAEKCIDITQCNIVIALPVMYLDVAGCCLKDSCIQLCAQNVDINVLGAFTGDISAAMLKDVNTQYVIVGHSERRINHKENNAITAQKFFVAHQTGLIPIVCVGENKKEYDAGYTHAVCIEQIDEIIKLTDGVQFFKNAVIAYEPIWAIGSKINAVPEKVQKIHKYIRDYIAKYDKYIAKKVLIQYGGSVTSENVAQFLKQSDIDGVLVGSASLDINSFVRIIKIAEQCKRLFCFKTDV